MRSSIHPTLLTLAIVSGLACWLPTVVAQQITIPREAILTVKGFELAPGLKADVYAAEPLVANPVAIHVDENGSVFVCETFRQEAGVEDNRDHAEWVDDDLAARTVEDRLALMKKHLKGKDLEAYRSKQDRIRMLVDRNGDGRADRSTVFVDGFRDYVDGTGAGVLARKGNVFYTCIPKLYAFRDDNNDGKADRKSTMYDGFGVRFAYRGHDLHGLCLGPDHRLYFSIGDRGYNVKTKTGRIADPESGAVFRCELDGTNLEVIATGLRNPQELAFDEFGNLFTCDNNSDSGDLARWLNIVEGGEYGWRMAYQYFGDRGPWNREALWDKKALEPAAYVIPPIENFGEGPAGLAYYPGTGLSPDYNGNFFLCDFRGAANLSGVRSFKLKPNGASFDLIDPEVFVWNCLATDICFAPDGSVMMSDWVEGWVGTGKGRIYRLTDPKHQKSKAVIEVAALLAKGMTKGSTRDLATLLAHVDQRVRLEAQFELARRGEVETLANISKGSKIQLAQVHAVWGLGEIGRRNKKKLADAANKELLALLRHPDEQVRIAAIRSIGDNGFDEAASTVTKRLYDDNPAIRAAAGIALSRIGTDQSIPTIVEMLVDNADKDPIVRHAAVMALTKVANDSQLAQLAKHEDKAVRMAGVLAARRKASPVLGNFLNDKDVAVVREAARAINDVPVPKLLPNLAKLVDHPSNDDAIVRRALNAHHHVGGKENANLLAAYAAKSDRPAELRRFGLGLVSNWTGTSSRDRVTGQWRPVAKPHSADDAVQAIKENLSDLVNAGQEIRLAAAGTAANMGITEVNKHLIDMLWDKKLLGKERAGAMLSLGNLNPNGLQEECMKAVKDSEPRVRAAGRIVLTAINPDAAIPTLREALSKGNELEKQSAVGVMANVEKEDADRALVNLMTMLRNGKLPEFLRLDVAMAAEKRGEKIPELAKSLKAYRDSFDKNDPLARHRDTLIGGNAERGKNLFEQRIALGCVRCHKAADQMGGSVGPDLSKIAAEKSREYLLQSIIEPSKEIAKGFDSLVIITEDGKVVTGVRKQTTEDKVILMSAEGDLITIDRDNIDEVSRGKSAMPDDLLTHLTPFDLRDLIEYLSTLK